MDREFETFRAGANEPIANRMHVTISPAKLILLNRNLFNKLGKPEAVSLSYSRKRDIIAVKPISSRLNEAFPVAPTGMSFRINAAPFCRHFNIKIDQTLRFVAPAIEDEGILHLDLNQTVSVARTRRRKR
ncbi:MAG TPA: hypothetical protein PKA82_00220 [Pyrinomonadaceae bacterium]|nr:hypothetical protein [Pyrinomonadaceae bacterium]